MYLYDFWLANPCKSCDVNINRTKCVEDAKCERCEAIKIFHKHVTNFCNGCDKNKIKLPKKVEIKYRRM